MRQQLQQQLQRGLCQRMRYLLRRVQQRMYGVQRMQQQLQHQLQRNLFQRV